MNPYPSALVMAALAAGAIALPSAHAQSWPTKPVVMIVPQAAGRIGILPGGGIRAQEVPAIAVATGVKECHLSAREALGSPMRYRRPDIPMCAASYPGEYERKIASARLIRMAKE